MSEEHQRGICFPDCLWLGILELGGSHRELSNQTPKKLASVDSQELALFLFLLLFLFLFLL